MTYSSRGRIGAILSQANTVCEVELSHMAPSGVSFHFARLFQETRPSILTQAGLKKANEDLPRAAASLRSIQPDVITFPHTLGSMVDGPDYDMKLTQILEEASGSPAITTSMALIQALKELGVNFLGLIAPYTTSMTTLELTYLNMALPTLTVVNEYSLGIENGLEFAKIPWDTTCRIVHQMDCPSIQAIFLSGSNWPTMEVIDTLESQLGKPILTANQVTLWAALKLMGIGGLHGPGIILREHLPNYA